MISPSHGQEAKKVQSRWGQSSQSSPRSAWLLQMLTACRYVETSALNKTNLNAAFEEAIKAARAYLLDSGYSVVLKSDHASLEDI